MDNKMQQEFEDFQDMVEAKFNEHNGMASEMFCAFMVMKDILEDETCESNTCNKEDEIDFDKLRGIVPDALLDAVLGKEKIETFFVVNKHSNGTDFFFQDAGVSNYKWITEIKEATVMSRAMAEMVANFVGGKVARKK